MSAPSLPLPPSSTFPQERVEATVEVVDFSNISDFYDESFDSK
jgi:hypothetical protein